VLKVISNFAKTLAPHGASVVTCHVIVRQLSLGLLALFLAGATYAAEQTATATREAKFIGAVGCKSSSCHGGAGEKRSQYITWTRQDFHSRSYAILTTARSARMAEALGLAEASTSARCTTCHSPFQAVAPARLASGADPREGVSCESCHGAAETWLRGHTRPDWTYPNRIGAGMHDLRSFYVRANTCIACHQNLDSALIAAGHPESFFEMDSQSTAEPKHWRDPEGSGVRAWLVGQAVALREVSWRLTSNPAETETFMQWNALAWLMNKITASDRTLLPIEPAAAAAHPELFARVQRQADGLARRAATQNFDGTFAARLRRELAASDGDFLETSATPRTLLFRRGQRLMLALRCLTNAVGGRANELELLQSDIRSLPEFDPARFADHLVKLRLSLNASAK
jgi:hypothetical protein